MIYFNSDLLKEFGFKSRKNKPNILNHFKTWHEKRVLDLAKKYKQEVYILDLNNIQSLKSNFTQAFFKLTGKTIELTHYHWANKKP